MPGCRIGCINIIPGMTNREIWEYVRTFYYGNYVETRDADDEARIAYEFDLNEQFNEAYYVWSTRYGHVQFERFMQWKYTYGTYNYGNLPEYKKDDNVGHCHAPCPYSTQSSDSRTRSLLGVDVIDPLPVKVDHTLGNKIYYMRTQSKGSVWGYECTFDNCPYLLASGQRYFYV